jgi:multicomponent Na+:H+ antiporter subunit D
MKDLLPLLIALPLGSAFLVVVLTHIRAVARVGGVVTLVAVAVNLTLAVTLCMNVSGMARGPGLPAAALTTWAGSYGALGVQLNCDGLSALMIVIINFIALAVIIYAAAYMRRFTTPWLFRSLFLLMVAAMNGIVLAGDLFNLYLFIEMSAICSYALVAFGCESDELEASFKYLTLGVLASTFILVGVAILYSLTGHLNMAKVADGVARLTAEAKGHGMGFAPAVMLAAGCLIAGLSLKAAMVPFHAWLPDAHPSAPAPISAMMSGVLIKAAGVYAMARIVFNVLGVTESYANILMTLGALSMVIGVFLAVKQFDLKRLLAYHSISQMGYVVVAIGAAAGVLSRPTPDKALAGLCLFGGLFHLLNHAIFKSLLFLTSGSIEQAAGTRNLKEMGGLNRHMPVTSFCCRIGALSISGVPPFNGFFSKLIIIVALVLAGYPVLAGLAGLVAFVTLLSFIKVQRYALEGECSPGSAAAVESPWPMGLGMLILAAACLLAGLGVVALKDCLFDPAGAALIRGTFSAAATAVGRGPL